MKFTVEQSAFTDGVNWVARSLSTRPIKTELLGIVIDAIDNQVFLSASDLETASKAHFVADVKEVGKVLVPGKLLAEISRSLPNKPITFVLEGSRVFVTSGSAKFTLPTLSVDEYPNLPELPDTTGVITSDTFATAVAQVAIAAGQPPARHRLRLGCAGHSCSQVLRGACPRHHAERTPADPRA